MRSAARERCAVMGMLVACSASPAQTFTGLGVLPGGNSSQATAISADGTAVTGFSDTPGGPRAFRWTASGGMVGLGTLPQATSSYGTGISGDGAVVVGYSNPPGGQRG